MQQAFHVALGLLLGLHLATAEDNRPLTPQQERGRELFLKSPKGTACGTCHAMAGLGKAIGPDLSKLASVVGPRGLVTAIQMTVTAYVQEVKVSDRTFPGIQKQNQGDEIEFWDLGQKPPMLRKLTSKQIVSLTQNRNWEHPPASAGYTSQELADLIGFLKWSATGSQKEIKVSDIEP
jgi:mono/diheme cytochrome c family protein